MSFDTPSRRDFLGATTALVAATALSRDGLAQPAAAKHRRLNVMDPGAARHIASYKKAIRAMLNLPPTDARNWYRNALVHTLDCPHGNWWFLVWHRGYIGWFEQIVREMSGDPQFALPYWDWTTEPRMPAVMYEDVLTPNDPAYIGKATEFKKRFEGVVAKADYWKATSPFEDSQYNQLLSRSMRFPADLWFDINDDPRGTFFFEPPIARGLTKEKPGLDIDADVLKAVSLPTVLNALSPRDFLTFGSARTFQHSGLTGFGVLEGQPHNLVHNCVGGAYNNPPTGGFMQANLSPVDPLFFLHHANIDRLWDVWTRKQQGFRLPILPEGNDLARWQRELFLFFMDANGKPVTKTKAGDYAAIGDFNYDYQPGSGEEVVPVTPPAAPLVAAVRRFNADVTARSVTASAGSTAAATATIPMDALAAGGGSRVFAKVTMSTAPDAHAGKFRVLIDTGSGAPQDAGVFAMFGHHNVTGPVTFTVPVPAPSAAGDSAGNGRISMRVVSEARPALHAGHGPSAAARAPAAAPTVTAEVESVVLEVH